MREPQCSIAEPKDAFVSRTATVVTKLHIQPHSYGHARRLCVSELDKGRKSPVFRDGRMRVGICCSALHVPDKKCACIITSSSQPRSRFMHFKAYTCNGVVSSIFFMLQNEFNVALRKVHANAPFKARHLSSHPRPPLLQLVGEIDGGKFGRLSAALRCHSKFLHSDGKKSSLSVEQGTTSITLSGLLPPVNQSVTDIETDLADGSTHGSLQSIQLTMRFHNSAMPKGRSYGKASPDHSGRRSHLCVPHRPQATHQQGEISRFSVVAYMVA